MRSLAWVRLLVAVIVMGGSVITLTSCGSGGGGGGTSTARLTLQSITAESGPELPWDQFFLNERVLIKFAGDVDPRTVNKDTIQIRLASSNFTIAAQGDFVVVGNVVSFVPLLPSESDLSDAGLSINMDYRVFMPGFPKTNTVRSTRGDQLPSDVSVTFKTRNGPPFLLDPVAGAPRVIAVALDLNGNGIIEADGDASTPEDEEFIDFDQIPIAIDSPVGLARAPFKTAIFVNEPLLPSTVFEDFDMDGKLDHLALIDVASNTDIPMTVDLEQVFLPSVNGFRVAIILTPITTLPPGTTIQAQIFEGITDTANPPFELDRFVTGFTTRTGPLTLQDALVEDFDDRDQFDPATSAEWDAGNSDVLVAGKGLGGSGIDGPLIIGDGEEVVLNTLENGGFFNFTTVSIAPDGILTAEGPNPLRIFATDSIDIQGTILIAGGDGNAGTRRGGGVATKGGVGGPGGGDGGTGNDPPNISFTDDPMQRGGAGGDGFPGGGGEGGLIGRLQAGGGGGGAHLVDGDDASGGSSAAQGGMAYGDDLITELLGGSGGGAGGDGSRDDAPEDESTGGAGGGGGGAILLNTSGSLSLTGVINADGGNGGAGGEERGNTPGGGGGGSGAGGAVKIQAFTLAPILDGSVEFTAVNGLRGASGQGGSTAGGLGSIGRLRVEAFDANRNGMIDLSEINIDEATATVDPSPSRGILDESQLGVSIALSQFLDTGTTATRFSFDATDPATGEVQLGPSVEDLLIPDGIPASATIRVLFRGAPSQVDNPSLPDEAMATGFVTDISMINGSRFIQYRIEFEIGINIQTAPRPVVERLQVRFEFDI